MRWATSDSRGDNNLTNMGNYFSVTGDAWQAGARAFGRTLLLAWHEHRHWGMGNLGT